MNFFPAKNQVSSLFDYPVLSGQLNRESNRPQQNHLNQFYCNQDELNQENRLNSLRRGERSKIGASQINQIRKDQINADLRIFKKPNLSYIALISQAINSRPDRRITLKEIYQFIEDTYPYYRFNQSRWQNSVRHNLSLNCCFERLPQHSEPGTRPSKVSYWTIRANLSNGFKESGLKTGKSRDPFKASRDKKLDKINFQPNRQPDRQPTIQFNLSVAKDFCEMNDEIVDKMICQDCKLSKQFHRMPTIGANSLKFTIRNLIEQQPL